MNNIEKMLDVANKAAANAYAPYSGLKVGCAVLAASGEIYRGCNVENVAYPVGTCAEAGAIAAMIAGGDKEIKEILIYADSNELITPCGACRQRIAEFANGDAKVYLADKDGVQQTLRIDELLPYAFMKF